MKQCVFVFSWLVAISLKGRDRREEGRGGGLPRACVHVLVYFEIFLHRRALTRHGLRCCNSLENQVHCKMGLSMVLYCKLEVHVRLLQLVILVGHM